MKKSKTFFACAMLAALASCSNDHVLSQQSPTPSDPDVINIVAASSKPVTRAAGTADDLQDTQFADNEKINVYLYEHNGNLGSSDKTFVDNPYVYTVSSGGSDGEKNLTKDGALYFPINGKSVDAYAFYPALSDDTKYNIISGKSEFTVATNQSDIKDYRKSDLMYGTNLWDSSSKGYSSSEPGTAKGNKVQLHFRHLLTKIVVKLVPGDGFTPDLLSGARIKLFDAKPKANITVSKSGIDVRLDGETNAPDGGYDLGTYDSQGNAAIIIPQAITTGKKFIEIALSGSHSGVKYIYNLQDTDGDDNSSMTFASGNQYTYKLTLSAGNVVVVSTEIVGWNEQTEIPGNAEPEQQP